MRGNILATENHCRKRYSQLESIKGNPKMKAAVWDQERITPEREDAKEPGSLAFIMKKLFSKQ